MTKAAATKKTTTPEDEVQRAVDALNPRRQFIAATANMGWRLAVAVVLPIVTGVKLDERFHSSPWYTLGGMVLAAGAGSATVWGTVRELNREQTMNDTVTDKTRSNDE